MVSRKEAFKNTKLITKDVSDLWTNYATNHTYPQRPVCIVCSDLHLCHNKPSCREPETDWYAAMERHLVQLRRAADLLAVPVVIAGDLFDRWNVPAELINFAIDALPPNRPDAPVIAVPGQHDLPNHDWTQMYRSAFGTLVKAGRIQVLDSVKSSLTYELGGASLYGFGWQRKVCRVSLQRNLNIAIFHRYCWSSRKTAYDTSAMKDETSAANSDYERFDLCFFGDNHIPFHSVFDRRLVVNCGAFIPRTVDEVKRPSSFYVVHDNGVVHQYNLLTAENKFTTATKAGNDAAEQLDLSGLEDLLKSTQMCALDFQQYTKQIAEKAGSTASVIAKLMEALQNGKETK